MSDHSITPPPTEERDSALGRYMDAWSRLETSIQFTTQDILGIDGDVAHVLFSAIQTFQSIKVLHAAAKLKFNEAGRTRVAKICERVISRNVRRNFIVHGSWRFRVGFGLADGSTEVGEWRRVYDHVDPDLPKSDDGSDLTVPELDKTTGHVLEMVEELNLLADDIPSLLVRPQTSGQ
ncbi:MAG: hypothetical protein V4618_13995 [Pseudomonadota bacterium]